MGSSDRLHRRAQYRTTSEGIDRTNETKSTTNSRHVPRYSAASRPDTTYDWADADILLRRIFRVAAPSNDGPLTDHIADLRARWAVAAAHAPKPTLARTEGPWEEPGKRSFDRQPS